MKIKSEKITIRVNPHIKLQLNELQKKYDVTGSFLIRTILTDFFIKNEKHINNLIDADANN